MASSDTGGTSVASEALTPAQKLQEKHDADAAHSATIEEVIDEEDIEHPPPSMQIAPESPTNQPASEPMSEKVAGKQKVKEEPDSAASNGKSNTQPTLDTQSEELFPALGAGPKSKAPAAAAPAWGAKKPSSVGAVGLNGVNGRSHLISSSASSRVSTPASGVLTDTSTNASAKPNRGVPQKPNAPGKHTDRFEFAPAQLVPRDQLKKPIKDVLQGINKKSKATVTMKPGPGGVFIFEGVGPLEDTRQALKDVAKEIGVKSKKTFPVPLSVRPHIIGKQGTVIKGISDRTGARVQIAKIDEPSASQDHDDDDDMTVDMTIEGDPLSLALAQQEIDSIVNERTSTVNLRLRNIPAEYYPFIAGPRNSRIAALEDNHQVKVQVPHFDSWSHQSPPQAPSTGMPATFSPHPHKHIRISGERSAAQAARAEIERHVDEELRRQITLSEIGIDRNRHQFVLADGQESLHSLLEETGCAVILPPASTDTEMLAVIGPHDRIDQGVERILELATSMHMHSIDVAKQHARAPTGSQAHARALLQYLQERQALEQLEKQYDARIILPTTNDGSLEVYSREGKNALRARSDIMSLINAFPPSRIRHVDVDPFYHEHIHQQSSQRLRDDFGVHLLLPQPVEESPQVFLVYEDTSPNGAAAYQLPRQRPSPAEIASFEKGLQQAQEHILELLEGQQEVDSRDLEVPSKYQDKVRRFVSREQQDAPACIPVQLTFSSNHAPSSNVKLRGPRDTLDEVLEKIAAFIESEKQDELERGHITTFDFPQKFANYLIGRKGESINKYREEFDVDIKINDGKVEIKGPKAKGEAAKSRILALAKKLEDEVTHTLTISPQYHRELIGAKGSYVNRLQDRYNVRIQFPRSGPNASDDRSTADASSDVGRNNRPNQAPDVVLVRGPRQGADKAREELLDLVQHLKDNSHSASVSVSQAQIPSLIGQGGREMDKIRLETGAKVDVPGSHEQSDSFGRVKVIARGTKRQVDDAKRLLEERVKTFDESVSRTLEVDKKYHKTLIGSGGSNIRRIVLEAGGPEDTQTRTRLVQFPRPESDSITIAFEGNQAVVEKIIASIQAFVDERENQVTEAVEVAPEKHRLLIGRGGETRRALESQFQVSIDVPRVTQQGPARSQVKLTGRVNYVAKAKTHIQEMVKDQEGETMQVPRCLHHDISDNGRFFRRLNNDFKVKVDHAGQQPPTKRPGTPKPRTNGAALPLITDDNPDPADNHTWEIVEEEEGDVKEGDIPWILRGSPENIEKARTALQKAIERAQAQAREKAATGYLVLPDPSVYKFVIGSKGAQIDAIRRQTGCKIDVPKDQTKGKAIEITGSRDGVEHAKDIILDVIANGGNGNRRES